MKLGNAFSLLFPTTKPPSQHKVRVIPPNIGHGNAHLDSLWYYAMRESIRALIRSLVEKELPDVTPLVVTTGHKHDENQSALDWWQAGSCFSWTSSGPAFTGGATVIDSTTETDYAVAPFVLPDGCSRIYPKAKISTVNAGDRLDLRVRVFSPGDLNSTTPIEGGRLGVSDYNGSTHDRSWMPFSPVDVSSLPTTNGVKLGVGIWSARVGRVGQVGYLWQTSYGLRQGH